MFHGLSAFPLTPVDEHGVDEPAFVHLVTRLSEAGVDSITALGSTGSYVYLTREQRHHVARAAVQAAGDTPVLIGIGALRTVDVLRHAEDAQRAGADAVLLAPVSYQRLTDDEVYGLYADVTAELSVPLCVYDNPGTTHFTFSDELHGRIAALRGVGSIKIPPTPHDPDQARDRVARLRARIPSHVTIGISGDATAAGGLSAGCDVWYSVLAGLWPGVCQAIVRAARAADAEHGAEATRLSRRLGPLWDLFTEFGSLRVVAAIAARSGLTQETNLPRPLQPLPPDARQRVGRVVDDLAPALDIPA